VEQRVNYALKRATWTKVLTIYVKVLALKAAIDAIASSRVPMTDETKWTAVHLGLSSVGVTSIELDGLSIPLSKDRCGRNAVLSKDCFK